MSDLISKQAAIDALRDAENHAFNSFYKGLIKAHKIIADLPSVNPQEPKIGKWILSGGYWRCSECKEKALLKLDKAKGHCKEYAPVRSIFCPNCGMKMLQTDSEPQESDDKGMSREDKYLLGCIFAIDRFIEKGSSDYAVKVDGKWELVSWVEIREWIEKQLGIEASPTGGRK